VDNKMITMIKWVRESTPKVLNPALPAPHLNFDDRSKSATISETKSNPASKRYSFLFFSYLILTSMTDMKKPEATPASPPPPSGGAPPPPPPPSVTVPAPQTGRNALLDSIRNPENINKLKTKQ
jgi:hypothetical protein